MIAEDVPESRYRLPRTVVPSRYDLVFEPDLGPGTFSGSEDVAVDVLEPIPEIVVNAVELEILTGRVSDGSGTRVEVTEVRLDPETERAHLALERTLEPGPWTLHLEFRGTLSDRLEGFYRSTYTDDEGTERVLATTHFESTDARRAFPCWDEPDLKAVFGVALVVDEGLCALSNGPEVARDPIGAERVAVRFADTIPMSTYLVALLVGPLEVTEAVDVDGVPLRVVHVPGKGHLTGFALEVGAFALRFFTEYYAIAYPGTKLDMVALPDFAQGAMENLGLITYRENLLLTDQTRATQPELQALADTVAHEIAHMWFGDLVTMRWWNGAWLNEAFATFMEMLCVNAFRPGWRRWDLHSRSRSGAFEIDALRSTRSIEYPVRSPEEANAMFDVLTYVKGASVLRMLEQYLGEDRFREGIRAYLEKHAYRNTDTEDLWDAIEGATGEPVRQIMDTWIWQGGFPLVSASTQDGELRLAQRRFVFDGTDDATRWQVPVLVRHGTLPDATVEPVLIADGVLAVPHAAGAAAVVNAGGHAFLRVRYAEDLRERLLGSLLDLAPIERYQLVDDEWAEVMAGEATAAAFCRLARAFADETDLSVWMALLQGLAWFERFLEGEPLERFRAFARELVRPALDRIRWEASAGDSDLQKSLRGELFRALGILGRDPEALALAREIAGEARADEAADPALAAAAVDLVASTGGPAEFDAFVAARATAGTPQEELRYLYALPRFREIALMDRVLAMTLTDEVRPQSVPHVVHIALANRDQGERAWAFLKSRWDELTGRVAPSTVNIFLRGVRLLTAPGLAEDARAFFADHDVPQSRAQVQQALELQRVASELRVRVTPELEAEFSA